MRKIIKTLLVVLVLCLVLTAFASCDKIFTKPTEKPTESTKPTPTEPVCVHEGGEATCTDPAVCSKCGEAYGEALGHDLPDDWHVTVDPTCAKEGWKIKQCQNPACAAIVERESIPATGEHVLKDIEAKDGTCVADGYTAHKACENCDYTEGKEVVTGTHVLEDVVAKEATCTEDGYTAHKACKYCDYTEGKEVVAASHTMVDVEAKEATCSEEGYSAHKACQNCDYTEGKEVVDKALHAMIYATTHPTADASGSTIGTCSACGEVVNYGEVGVMGAGTYVLNASDLDGIAQYTLIDGEVKVVAGVFDCHLSNKYRTDAGQKKTFPDEYFGEYRMNFGGKTEFGTEENPDRIKNGIVFTTTGETTVTVWWVEGGDDHRQVGLYNLAGEIVVQSDNQTAEKNQACIDTFTVPAGTYVLGNVINTNYIFKVEVVVGEAHTHVLNDVEGKAATCTEDGYTAHKACECGYTEGKEVVPAGHTLADVEAKAATCTEDGYTAHKACANCDYTEGKEVVPAGHTLADVEAKAATCTEDGYTAHKACANCDYTEGKEVVAAGHVLEDVAAKDATCAVEGYTAHKACANCDYTEGKEVLPSPEHVDETGDYKCDGCSTKMLPADGTTLTIEQALTIAKLAGSSYTTQKYYITGIVTNVYNTTYGNLYLKDGNGNQICIYGLYTWDKAVRYDKMEYKPIEGDELTVYTILGAYGTTYQGKDAWVDEVVAHEHNYESVVTAPTCLKDGYTTHTCSICDSFYKDAEVPALGHTTENGVCDNCGLTIGGDAAPVEVTVSKTAAEIMGLAGLSTTNGTGVNNKEIALDGNVSVIFSQGKAGTAPAYYSPAIRLYQNGATLTVKGTGMKTIVITVNSTSGDGPISVVGGTASALTNMTYTITVNEGVDEVVITTTGTDKNSRVYVSNVEVVYEQ